MVLRPSIINQTGHRPHKTGRGEKISDMAHLRIHLSRLSCVYVVRGGVGVENCGGAIDKTLLRGSNVSCMGNYLSGLLFYVRNVSIQLDCVKTDRLCL